MKNVMVTGGAGFIGSNFVRYMLKTYDDVRIINLDALTYAGSLENLKNLPDPDRHTFVQGDICDYDVVWQVMQHNAVDTIVHFAAESHVDRSIWGPGQFISTNVVGTFHLLEAARKLWVDEAIFPIEEVRFHHISTDEVFGTLEASDASFSETTPYFPQSPYSASKASSDHLVRAYYHTYGLPVTMSNCSNNYGPYQFPEKLIPLVILNACDGKPLPLYGDGKQIRDWLYVEDHCEAIDMILRKGRLGETYNVGGENQPTNLEVVEHICSILDSRRPADSPHRNLIRFVKDRPGHDYRYAMNIHKIQTELGWSPRWNLLTGLEKTVDWYLSETDWVAEIGKRDDFQSWINHNYTQRGAEKA